MSSLRITDRAGFWMIVFCGFGLVLLGIAEPRIHQRYDDLEARRVFVANSSDSDEFEPLPYPKYSLRPVQWMLFIGCLLGLFMLGMNWITLRKNLTAKSKKISRSRE